LRDAYLGRRIGGYEFVARIGEGGMGAVYRARRLDSGGVFAIKVIKRGMDTETVLRRFHNERRILETLRHDNIAGLLDAGTTPDGLPYFVMEHIDGQPIGEFCDARRLSIEERLRLFLKVCAAVGCAHESHVVHRDIKPENILVTADGDPKLLDFGIAKVLDFTNPSHEATITLSPVMTPHYASPEQARGAPVTEATDIYSLGVLLYELLTGLSPYRTAGATPSTLLHAIIHERPQRPSLAVARFSPADPQAEAIAGPRSTDPVALRKELAGDLDSIVCATLEKSPVRRYQTTAEFAADLRRHLDGKRVDARRWRRRLARVAPGTRHALAATLIVLLFVAAAAAIYLRGRGRPGVRPAIAVLGFENLSHDASAEWLSTALTEMLSTELAAGGKLLTVPGETVTRVKVELALPNAQTFGAPTLVRLRDSLGADYVVLGSYLALGDGPSRQVRLDLRLQDTRSGEVVASASETRPAVELVTLVTRAGDLLRRRLGAGSAPAADSGSVRGAVPEGEAARAYSEGLERLRMFDTLGARDLLRSAVAAAPDHAQSHAALAAASSLLGYDAEARDEAKKALDLSAGLGREDRLTIEGRYFETTHAWAKAVQTYEELRRFYPDNIEYGLRLANAQTQAGDPRQALATIATLGTLPTASRDPRVDLAEAEAALGASDMKAATAAAERAAQSGADQGFRTLAARAYLLQSRIAIDSGDPQASLAASAQAQQMYLAAGHRQGVAWALNESAAVLTQRGDVAGARARYEEALAVCRTIGDQSCVGTDLDSIGVLRRRQGDLQGALQMHKEALEVRRAVEDRAGVATSLYNIGNVLEVIGDLPRARQAASESLDIRRQLGERRVSALTLSRLGNIRRREGDLNAALQMTTEAVTTLRTIGDRGGVAMALVNLGQTLFDRGDLAGARAAHEEALAVRRQQHDRNNTAQTVAALAQVALAQDRLPEAESLITESVRLRQELGETIALAQTDLIRSEILLERNRGTESEKAARDAGARFRRAGVWGGDAESAVALARAQVARGDVTGASATLEAAAKALADTKDARLLLRRDQAMAEIRQKQGRAEESAALLESALATARRLGYTGVAFEIELAISASGRAPSAELSREARSAGFLLVARKAR
jgi:tetratricopeptide (TPR) repeat protein